jgi:shikimate kinase
VAGGAVLDPDNRRRLADGGTVVWLRADVETLARRVGAGKSRPLLTPDPESALRRLYLQRRPIYEAVADVVVDVDHRSAADVAEAILAELDR